MLAFFACAIESRGVASLGIFGHRLQTLGWLALRSFWLLEVVSILLPYDLRTRIYRPQIPKT